MKSVTNVARRRKLIIQTGQWVEPGATVEVPDELADSLVEQPWWESKPALKPKADKPAIPAPDGAEPKEDN